MPAPMQIINRKQHREEKSKMGGKLEIYETEGWV